MSLDQQSASSMELRIEGALIAHMLDYYQYIPLDEFLVSHPHWSTSQIQETLQLLQAIISVDLKTMETLAPKLQLDFLLQPSFLERKVYSYTQNMMLNLSKHEYSDYLRGLTPLLVDVLRLVVAKHAVKDLDQFVMQVSKETPDGRLLYKGLQWNQEKIEQGHNRVQKTWQKYYGKHFNYNHYVSSSHLLKLLMDYAKDESIKETAAQVRQVEKDLRNIVAHEVLFVDENWLKMRSNMDADEIHAILMRLIYIAGLDDQRQWDVISDLNEQLKELFKARIEAVQGN